MLLQEDFKNITVRELEEMSNDLVSQNNYKSSRIAEILNELYFIISDTDLNFTRTFKTENNSEIIFENGHK
jgi:hypothetical protein